LILCLDKALLKQSHLYNHYK